jgi:Xaa-Pro aminopeptidase
VFDESARVGAILNFVRFCSFTGSAGMAVVTRIDAYMIVDSRYWVQARKELDSNWHVVRAGSVDGPKDWIEWLVEQARDCRVGIDARMLAYEKATLLNTKLQQKNAKLFYPPQNLVDLIWKDKPSRSREPVFVQPLKLAGMEAGAKIAKLRQWIKAQAPSVPTYSKSAPTATQVQEAVLVSNLGSIGMCPRRFSLGL